MDPQQSPQSSPLPQTGQFDQVVENLRGANNVLVTVNTSPTVDQLAACIGLTLVLNKLGKHATAVFSGEVPSTIDFLQPEKTLERTTNSLRDFIISLDKSKADKLRYKVEDSIVKIYITPYKTSLTEKDLDFSQGDFNVDAVVTLGVHDKVQLDQAILAHGRILHDAVVMSLNVNGGQQQLGSVAWVEPNASSLCEMVSDVSQKLSENAFDQQVATALLTGIVAETQRFSNQKASPHTMSVAGVLMSAGASTQLVSTKLEAAMKAKPSPIAEDSSSDQTPEAADGLIQIPHSEENEPIPPAPETSFKESDFDQDDQMPKMIHEPPEFGGQLTANTIAEHEQLDPSTDPLSKLPMDQRELIAKVDSHTIEEIERAVESPHIDVEMNDAQSAMAESSRSFDRPEQPTTDSSEAPLNLDFDEPDSSPEPESPNSPPPPVPPPMMPPM